MNHFEISSQTHGERKKVGFEGESTSILTAWTTTGNAIQHHLCLGTTVLDQTSSPFHQRVALVVGEMKFEHFLVTFLVRCLGTTPSRFWNTTTAKTRNSLVWVIWALVSWIRFWAWAWGRAWGRARSWAGSWRRSWARSWCAVDENTTKVKHVVTRKEKEITNLEQTSSRPPARLHWESGNEEGEVVGERVGVRVVPQ